MVKVQNTTAEDVMTAHAENHMTDCVIVSIAGDFVLMTKAEFTAMFGDGK